MSGQSVSQPEWIDKHAAAKRTGLSASRVLGLADEGKIQKKPGRNERGQPIVLLHAGDIERYIYERDHPELTKLPAKVQEGRSLPARLRGVEFPEYDIPTPAPRPWLTLDEAVAFSGLTKRWLLDCAAGNLPIAETLMASPISVRDMGKHSPGGRWRFHRDSLEKA